MTPYNQTRRNNQRPVPSRNLPLEWNCIRREDNHHGNEHEADNEGKLKVLDDTRYFNPECGFLHFFSSGTPGPNTCRASVR